MHYSYSLLDCDSLHYCKSPLLFHLGFTLLELITTLAILSFLITISYPVYNQYVMKTHRVTAKVALLDLASNLERYHVVHNTYVGAVSANKYTEDDFYKLDISNATGENYLLTATPSGAQIQDKTCGTLSLNELGQRDISGSGTVVDCW